MTHSNLLTATGGPQNGGGGGGGSGTGGGAASAASVATPTEAANAAAVSLARYQNHQNYNSVHSSQNGPRSLSDSSQAESPVQDDLLTSSNTPNSGTNSANAENGTGGDPSSFPSLSLLQHHHHQQQQQQQHQHHGHHHSGGQGHGHHGGHHHSGHQSSGSHQGGQQSHHQHQNHSSSIYGGNGGAGGGVGGNNGSNCNGSIYPVLPASLLYSQLYSAANQGHSFHGHGGHNVGGHNPSGGVNGELQSVMDQITTTAAGTGLGLGNGIGLGNAVGGLVAGKRRVTTGDHMHLLIFFLPYLLLELTLVGNCESALRSGDGDDGDPVNIVRGSLTMGGPRGQTTQPPGVPTDNGNSVWRPY